MRNAPIVVVTGANRGIGLEISRQLATCGAQVVLTARKSGAGKAAVKTLAAQNLTVQFRLLDVTLGKSIAAREFLKRTYGRLDVLINNAGIIASGDAAGLKVDMETVRVTLETNALGPFHLSQALAPLLLRSKRARIVNVSSGMGALSEMEDDYAAFRISKTPSMPLQRSLRPSCGLGPLSTPPAQAGLGPTWAAGVPSAMLLRAPIRPSGSPSTRHRARRLLHKCSSRYLTGKFVRDRRVISW
jgi:NAD(P)-dependent dehydrogenase (short-subunit alcohol dehydrogenase family)